MVVCVYVAKAYLANWSFIPTVMCRCAELGVMLGNVYEHSLDEIFNSREATKVQCQYSRECNGCWINFHRKYDIILLRNLEKVFPKSIIEVFYGKYQWTGNRAETYRKYIKKIGF